MIAKRIENISPSATLEIDAKAKQMKKEGKDIVIFGAGEPDFDTPENIKEAAKESIDNNQTRYTPPGGLPELKNAIVKKFSNVNSIEYNSKNVIVGCGAKHVLFNIALTLIENGDEVILPKPYWVSFDEMIKVADGKTVFCETDEKFKLKASDIEGKITKKTKMLILNSPSNPSGAVVEESELKKIAELAVKHNFYVISDECYEYFVYGGKKHVSIASLNDKIKDRTITVNSFSKTYAMTGWRVGYCGAKEDLIKAMGRLQGHSTGNVSNAAQMAALEAINGPQDSVNKMLLAFDERRKFVFKRLNEMKGTKCVEPEGAFYAFPDISGTGMDSLEFSSKLLDEALVAVVPGIAFGSDNHIRISYATSMDEIKKGMDRMDKWLRGDRK